MKDKVNWEDNEKRASYLGEKDIKSKEAWGAYF